VTSNDDEKAHRRVEDAAKRLDDLGKAPAITPGLRDIVAQELNQRSRLAELLAANNSVAEAARATASLNNYFNAAQSARDALTQASAISPLGEFSRSFASRESLNNEISELRRKITDATAALDGARKQDKKSQRKVEELQSLVNQLRVKEDLGFLLTRVNAKAQNKLTSDEEFRAVFSEDKDCRAFVISVDIRRSTELMLKARTPSLFADFISRLTRELYECVVRNNGVFDKFTGDGILAFFPEDFSGEDFGYLVVRTAVECHEVFKKIYKDSRGSFTSVLNGIGLGIGIDLGQVRLLRVAEGLTVVGVPVVYACRMSGANPGQTLLNQPAFEIISERYGKYFKIHETSLQIKHEGEILAYQVAAGDLNFDPAPPEWWDESA
jgi:class 3 adenylate cyclase